jgi:hypothetical protein
MRTRTGSSVSFQISLREEDDVESVELLGAVGRPQVRLALDHQQPLLLAVLVVVRAESLPRR